MSLISIRDLSKAEILSLLEESKELKKEGFSPFLEGKIVASCFFEPSTRTRLSFESATLRAGGKVIGFADPLSTSSQKGESLEDAIRVISSYADLIVLRHPESGAAKRASLCSSVPILNAGDGASEHPTQTLTDLFTIWDTLGSLEELNVAIVGDLRYGRTTHSLAKVASLFAFRLFLVSPPELSLPDSYLRELDEEGVLYSLHTSIDEVIENVDLLYMTRLQKERLSGASQNVSAKDWTLSLDHLKRARPHLKVLHPLPRLEEIPTAIDQTEHAAYFAQAANSLFVRGALLRSLLARSLR